ncbi:MAG: midcut-by-XrtH protein [Cellvibrionaceae bacterium]|nr:midcut-by-XrtH protein [Cellvibrionaceae bacterium]MCV6628113.1 midcut-by-XrtH protein [Cellvibrionaceae bacterium]
MNRAILLLAAAFISSPALAQTGGTITFGSAAVPTLTPISLAGLALLFSYFGLRHVKAKAAKIGVLAIAATLSAAAFNVQLGVVAPAEALENPGIRPITKQGQVMELLPGLNVFENLSGAAITVTAINRGSCGAGAPDLRSPCEIGGVVEPNNSCSVDCAIGDGGQ